MTYSFGSVPLTVIVGHEPRIQTFLVYESVAVKFSDFLAAAIRYDWKEARERVLRLPDNDPEHFEIFQAFKYTGRIFCHKPGGLYTNDTGQSCDRERAHLAQPWAFGERLQAPAFKDALVDAFIEAIRTDGSVPIETYHTIYARSAGPSPMRRLHVDIALWIWPTDTLKASKKHGRWNGFFFDLAAKEHEYLVSGRPKVSPYSQGSTCIYHEHGETGLCYKTMFK